MGTRLVRQDARSDEGDVMAEVVGILWQVAGFVVALSILVCVHEYGHYWMARRLGVKVLRFSLGFGKPIKSFTSRDGVEWAIGPFPLGGYVKLLGEQQDGIVAPSERHMAFRAQSVPRRLAILFAGPAANFLLAIFLYWVIFMLGVEGMKPVIAKPMPGSAAALVGLQSGEEVAYVDGRAVPTWTDLKIELVDHAFDSHDLRLEVKGTDGARRNVTIDLSKVRRDPQYLFDDLGLSPYQPPADPVLGDITPGSAAENAGLAKGDRVLAVDGEAIDDWSTLVMMLRARPGEVVHLQVRRGAEELAINAVLASEEENGRAIGRLGAALGATPNVDRQLWQNLRAERRLGPIDAFPAALGQTWQMTQLTVRIMFRMVMGDVSVKNISGPIQIAQVAGITAQIGLVPFLSFMAVVSVSIGLLNLMPIPVLDGGQMAMFAIEGIKGRPLSERAQVAAIYVGFAVVGMLMVVALYNDIMRLV